MAEGKLSSFFHDVPLALDSYAKTAAMVVEIPRYTQAKFEISKELPLNPIVQDTKNGKLRFVNNVFPFHGYPFNYGALPQTWEDPTFSRPQDRGFFGDNDPVDVVEIGGQLGQLGLIKTVMILGALALIDDGEMDWKLIAIDTKDPMAGKLTNGIKDVEKLMPGALDNLRTWFKNYKRPTGKPENAFAFGGKYLDASEAVNIIEECHGRWRKLVRGKIKSGLKKLPETANVTLEETPGFQSFVNIQLDSEGITGRIPDCIHSVYYYKD
ncbi:hypothetical protein FOA43_004680 [Brettanomyces nanus]|uniref:inorganic diphosphatase n=1 Tax=Eeniella nana TaxID=13502 RepID=A0A875SC61_EENNA|nr:uncharacterized protein FOA43_004680 [Brettanomyces nanus]QPG77272.1 hypothetical protein FOA43_004680 [Brettanomyces nanus]